VKKAASVFLLAIFLFNIAGVFCLYSVMLYINHENIFNSNAQELNLVRLTIEKTETIHWKSGHEIIYDGKCYDILSQSEDGRNYSLLCYADSKEDLLNEVLNKQVSIHQQQSTEQKSCDYHFSVKVFIPDFILHSSLWKVQLTDKEKTPLQISFSLSQGFLSVFYPPPKA
jgi:hypothetical protein